MQSVFWCFYQVFCFFLWRKLICFSGFILIWKLTSTCTAWWRFLFSLNRRISLLLTFVLSNGRRLDLFKLQLTQIAKNLTAFTVWQGSRSIYCFHGSFSELFSLYLKRIFYILYVNILLEIKLDTIEEHQDEIWVCFSSPSTCKMFQMSEDTILVCHLSKCMTFHVKLWMH